MELLLKSILELGKGIRRLILYLGEIGFLSLEIIYWIFSGKKRIKNLVIQMLILGVESFPLVSLIAFFTGVILAFQTAYQLQRISSEIYIAPLVALSITRELGPVLTSLIIAGRSGASIAAEVASMKVTEQLDALKSLATNPVDYLTVPRFISLIITLPILVLYADFIGILGGYVVGSTKLGISLGMYLRMSVEALVLKDVVSGLIKAFIFGGIIGVICSYEGFSSLPGATGVGRAVIKAVVRSFMFILLADCILTALFYVLFP